MEAITFSKSDAHIFFKISYSYLLDKLKFHSAMQYLNSLLIQYQVDSI